MWDSNSPLQLLNTMPRKLSKENLEKLQLVIDADKYKNSLISGFDLCGMYAPFCRGCKKTSIYPCAIAYINMMKAGGADIEIDAKPVMHTETKADVPAEEPAQPDEVQPEIVEVPVASETPAPAEEVVTPVAEEIAVAEEEVVIDEPHPVEEVVLKEVPATAPVSPVKKKIRIAFARRKI
ncbi:MAG: hypothetical protein K2L12_08090 [Clostridia bacterium]|nr:hypothetical protein [Clostridia bacterium]